MFPFDDVIMSTINGVGGTFNESTRWKVSTQEDMNNGDYDNKNDYNNNININYNDND